MEQIIEKFYTAFAALDAETMASCYHPEVVFKDPAFGELKGDHAKNMWRMLCASQKKGAGIKIVASDFKANGNKGSAHWEAYYEFSATGRKVHNVIDAAFEFKDGLIIKHTDSFDLHKWAKQAMGFKGLLLGGTILFRKKIQQTTSENLKKFEAIQ